MARELERRWEEALKPQRQLEDEYERWQRTAPGRLSTDDERGDPVAGRPTCRRCGRRPTTTPAERQRIARLLLERVVVTVDKASERVDVELHWVGGLVRVARPRPAGERGTTCRPTTRGWSRGCGSWCGEAAQRGGDRRAAQRRGLPAAEASRPVHGRRWCGGSRPAWGWPAGSATGVRRAWGRTSTGRWPCQRLGVRGTRSGGGCVSGGSALVRTPRAITSSGPMPPSSRRLRGLRRPARAVRTRRGRRR